MKVKNLTQGLGHFWFYLVLDQLKTGHGKRESWPKFSVSRSRSGWHFQRNWKSFLDGYGHYWMRTDSNANDQLSETKVGGEQAPDKSTTSRFNTFSNYASYSNSPNEKW